MHIFLVNVPIGENHHRRVSIVDSWQRNFCVYLILLLSFLRSVNEGQTKLIVVARFISANIQSFKGTFTCPVISNHTFFLTLQNCLLVLIHIHFKVGARLIWIVRIFSILDSRRLFRLFAFLFFVTLLQILIKLFHYLV